MNVPPIDWFATFCYADPGSMNCIYQIITVLNHSKCAT